MHAKYEFCIYISYDSNVHVMFERYHIFDTERQDTRHRSINFQCMYMYLHIPIPVHEKGNFFLYFICINMYSKDVLVHFLDLLRVYMYIL